MVRVRPTLGVDLYAPANYTLPTVTTDGARDIAYLHSTLAAQAIGLVWNLTARADGSDTVHVSAQSLSPAAIARLTMLAESAGMTVQYRPLIRVGPVAHWNRPTLSWEGFIRPARPKAWFASLYRAELPYLRVAQRLHVTEFVVGTELQRIGDSSWWPWFLAKVRSVYRGTVSYAAAIRQFFAVPSALPPVPDLGLDAYPSLRILASASQRQVIAAWESYFGKLPATQLHRTALDEVGITATAGAYRHPADWNAPGITDLAVQSRWFTAACVTAAHFEMRAVYFYELRLSADPAQPSPFRGFFAGKPGAEAISNCRSILRG